LKTFPKKSPEESAKMIDDFVNLKDDIREYLELRFDQIRLSLAEATSRIVSRALNAVIAGGIIALIFLFLSISAGFYFGRLLESVELGFLCVAGIYLLLLSIFLLLRRKLIDSAVIKCVMTVFFPKPDRDEK